MVYKRRAISSQIRGKILQDEIRNELKALGEEAARPLNELVATWENLHFEVHVESGPKRILLSIVDKGDEMSKKRWAMVDYKGRERRTIITAKKAGGRLKFQPGYVQKTGGGSGEYFGNYVFPQAVIQGAVEPQGHTDKIKKEILEPGFRRRIRNAYRRAFRKSTGRSI
jgi:hypothetical protein